MRALLLNNPASIEKAPLQETELPIPHPGAQEVLIQVQVCGLCHTDLHIVEGELALPRLPVIPGHQIVGIVEEAGDQVELPNVGDRVGVAWLNSTCGRCEFCTSERENLCPEARFTGYHRDGGYADYVTVPSAFTYSIPEAFSDEQAAPLLCGGVTPAIRRTPSSPQPASMKGIKVLRSANNCPREPGTIMILRNADERGQGLSVPIGRTCGIEIGKLLS